MIDLIKKLDIDDNTKNALIVAFNESKTAFENKISTLQKTFDTEKADLTSSLEKFKDYEELKTKIGTLTEQDNQNKLKLEELSNRSTNDKINFAIEKELLKSNAKHTELLMSAIDKSSISIKDDAVIGLDEAMKKVKESYSDLFNVSPNLQGKTPTAKTTNPIGLDVDNMSAKEVAANWTKILEQKRR